jgi:hypothetical protein
LPLTTFEDAVTARLVPLPCAAACCTNAGTTAPPDGVTALEAAESGPVPTELVADTLNVYVVPFVSPVIVVLVAGGDPDTVVGVWAVDPMYGVTVYFVI